MKKTLSLLAVFLSIVLLYSQCQDNEMPGDSDRTFIQEARDYFQDLTLHKQGINVDSVFSSNRNVAWDEAYIKNISTGRAVFVPIHYIRPLVITNSQDKGRYYSLDNLNNLVIYQDKSNTFHAEQIIWLPDANYKGLNKKFTGILTVHDWDGHFLESLLDTMKAAALKNWGSTGCRRDGWRQNQGFVRICTTFYGHNSSPFNPTGF